ncbi:MAG: GNAT family N-acetyltransferase [Clostridiales bacterium]|nr:GNAT family N-acetyltransferase [Clostridiales bacterium]
MALADYIENKPVIETERLRLRPMTAADVPALRKWMPDPLIYTYWGKGPSGAEKEPELLFERKEKPSKSFHLGISFRTEGQVIGDIWVYLIENDRMASVAVRLSRQHQGNGYGTEALSAMTRFCFEHTELKRLWTEVDVRNTASARMLEKCGYTREGMIRQGKMVNTWCDYYIYGILSTDPAAGGNGPEDGMKL